MGDQPRVPAGSSKGGQSKDWRKTFKNREDLNKWADNNDAVTRGSRLEGLA
jgi:hypothetical protein